MKRYTKLFSVLMALVLMLAVLVGCNGGGTEPSTSPSDTGGGEATGGEPTDGGTAPEGEASKTLRFALSENMSSLDPTYQLTLTGKVVSQMYLESPLIYIEELGEYIPWLCESYEFSDDSLTWTFHLREGITFNNGEVLNADDWVATFQRLLDDRDGPISSQYWKALESVEKVDDYTVVLKTSEPIAAIRVSLVKTYIFPNEAYEELGESLFNDQICYGSGPWVFEEWIDGQYARFTKNENYWNKEWFDSYYDEVYINMITEPSTAVAAHLAGDIQAYIPAGGVNPDMLPLYAGTEDKTEVISFVSGNYVYLGMSFKEGSPFLDENVRFALEHAIDRQTIVDNVIGGGEVPNSQILSHCLGYNPDLEPYVFDPELAKEYLDKSTYDGSPIVISTNNSIMKGEDILLAISENLNDVGFNTSIEVVEVAALLSMRQTGEYDIFLVNNMQGCGDPGNDLTNRILNDAHHSFYSGPASEALNALITESNRELDVEKRASLLQQCMINIRENAAPHSFIAQYLSNYPVDYGVTGMELFADGTYRFQFVTHDPDYTGNEGPDFTAMLP